MTKLDKMFVFALMVTLPLVSSAATTGGLSDLLSNLQSWVNSLIPILMTLALAAFFWGLVKYIMSAGDEEKASSGKGIMIWGVIALFVMVSIWGLTGFLSETLGLGTGSAPEAGDLTPTS